MAKISNLPLAEPLTGGETVPVVQNGKSVRADIGVYIDQAIAPSLLDASNSAQAAAAAAMSLGPIIDGVLVASSANLALTGEQNIDGEITNASRVLLVGQSDASENGVWTTAEGAWVRYESASHASGLIVSVKRGSGSGQWKLNSANPIVVGTDDLSFVQILANDSDRISYQYGAPGTKPRSMQVKGEDNLHVDDFLHGVVGIDNLTAALGLFHDTVHTTKKRGILAGRNYIVNGPISSSATHPTGGMNLFIDGAAKIEVADDAPFASHLLYCATSAPCNVSITGSPLHIDLKGRIARAIYARHFDAQQGGQAIVEAPLFIENVHNGLGAGDAYAVVLIGNFAQLVVRNAKIDGVSRAAVGGESKGIAFSGYTGNGLIENCWVSRVTCPDGAADADGYAAFAKQTGGDYGYRAGEFIIRDCLGIDCSGRMLKLQTSEAKVIGFSSKRQHVVAIANSTDIDSQFGNTEITDVSFEYLENDGSSPLGASHIPIAFQQTLDDAQMVSRASGIIMKTQVAMPRLVGVIYNQSGKSAEAQDARFSHTIIEGVKVERVFGFAGSAFTRGIVEANLAPLALKPEGAKISLTGVTASTSVPAIALTGLSSSDDMSTKFSFHIDDVENTLGGGPAIIGNISGAALTEAADWHIGTTRGFKTLMAPGWTFAVSSLKPGCKFSTDIETVNAAPAPEWGLTGYALWECDDQWFGASDKNITVTKDGGNAANTIFKTRDSGANWNVIK